MINKNIFHNEGKVWVTINDHREIPFIGKGPFLRPINILEENYEILRNMGYKIQKVKHTELNLTHSYLSTDLSEIIINQNNDKVEEENTEVVEEQPTIIPEVEETKEEELVEEEPIKEEEVIEEEPLVENVEWTEENLKDKTKKELKDILDGMGKEYLYKDNVEELKKKILEA